MCANYGCLNASYNVSNIPGYENFTTNNFFVKVTSMQTNTNGNGANGTQNPLNVSWSYSAPTLTVTAGGRMYGQLGSAVMYGYINGDVYFIPVAIEY